MNQQTLNNAYSFQGPGLHTGKTVRLRICPAPADTGIVFVRTDLGGASVPALASMVGSTARSTHLGSGRLKVRTVEHLLSALTGLGVDNAIVELDGAEVPILDGSAAPYVNAIAPDGLLDQGVPRKCVTVDREIVLRDDKSGAWIKITPSKEFSVDITIDFNSSVIGVQNCRFAFADGYAESVASCRTFCFLHEILPQLSVGLIKGGDLDNAIVVVEKPVPRLFTRFAARVLNKKLPDIPSRGYLADGGLRFPDECCRHKLLDLIGDLRLCGGMPCFKVEAYKPGHALNTEAAKQILKSA